MKKTICVDFDGVIHSYTSGWCGARNIPDPPVEGAIEFLHGAIQLYDVVILSTRLRHWGGRAAIRSWLKGHAGNLWYDAPDGCLGMERIRYSAVKVPAIIYIDDRAWRFEGRFPDPRLLDMRPWNRQSGSPYLVVKRRDGLVSQEQNPDPTSRALSGRVIDHCDQRVIRNAAELMRRKLGKEQIEIIRAWIEADPENWFVTQAPAGWHFAGGMSCRNALRKAGFDEERLGVANLDDVYLDIVSLAVRTTGDD